METGVSSTSGVCSTHHWLALTSRIALTPILASKNGYDAARAAK